MQFHLSTLGCKVNQYETQVIREAWERQGHACVNEPEQAQVILVHSCAVTQKALADLRKNVSALRRAAPGVPVMISGCAAQTHGPELSGLDGVVRVLDLKHRGLLTTGPEALLAKDNMARNAHPQPVVLEGVSGFSRSRAQVKIQDGCSHGCTYCIVPLARGAHQSRAPRAVLEEVRRLLAAGFRELSLIGINLRLYGLDLEPPMDFWDLVGLLEQTFAPEWAGRARFRMSSLDPAMLGAKALDTLSASRMLCPHLHLSLQSGSQEVLRRMGRGHCAPETIAPFCAELTRAWPMFGLGADLLTGFPGEQDVHFQETRRLCAKLPLSYAHVFPYSLRPGTPAAAWPDQIPDAKRRNRAAVLRALARTKKDVFLRKAAQCRELNVVVEGMNPTRGKSEYYVDCRLQTEPGQARARGLLKVRPVGVTAGSVACVPFAFP